MNGVLKELDNIFKLCFQQVRKQTHISKKKKKQKTTRSDAEVKNKKSFSLTSQKGHKQFPLAPLPVFPPKRQSKQHVAVIMNTAASLLKRVVFFSGSPDKFSEEATDACQRHLTLAQPSPSAPPPATTTARSPATEVKTTRPRQPPKRSPFSASLSQQNPPDGLPYNLVKLATQKSIIKGGWGGIQC